MLVEHLPRASDHPKDLPVQQRSGEHLVDPEALVAELDLSLADLVRDHFHRYRVISGLNEGCTCCSYRRFGHQYVM